MINMLYGIDYDAYACGGIANQKLMFMGSKTLFFVKESEMLKEVARLKEECTADNIVPFVTTINREEYKI